LRLTPTRLAGQPGKKEEAMDEKTAKRAAKWWADFLRRPVPPDNGDRSEIGIMTLGLGSMLQDTLMAKFPADGADKFEAALVSILTEIDRPMVTLDVDYHPDYTLNQAAERAGVDVDWLLPLKSVMWISGDEIRVAQGYGSPIVVLED